MTCTFSGKRDRRSRMLAYGDHFVAPEHKDAFVRRLESGDPAVASRGYQDAPRTVEIGLILRQAFGIMAQNWLPVGLILVVIWLPVDLIFNFIDWHLVDYENGTGSTGQPLTPTQSLFLPYLLNLTIGLVGEACFFLVAHRAWYGQSTDFLGLVPTALGTWSRLFRTRILVMLMIGIGFLLLVIPGLYLAAMAAVCDPTVVAEKRRPFAAIQRSFQLVQGKGPVAFFFAIIFVVILLIPQFVVYQVWDSLGIDSWLTSALLWWATTIPMAIAPFVFYVLYQHLLGRFEGEKSATTSTENPPESAVPA